MTIDLSKFVDEERADDDQVATRNRLVARALELQNHLAFLERAVDNAKKQLAQIVEKDLVEVMVAMGDTEFKTEFGTKVSIVKGLVIYELKDPVKRIERANKQAEWLESVGGQSVIKEEVAITFDKGYHAQYERVLQALEQMHLPVPVVHGASVHPSSLKSFVTKYMEDHDDEPPLKDLGLFLKTEAKIKTPKES